MTELNNCKLMIATPASMGWTHVDYSGSLIGLTVALINNGIPFLFYGREGSGIVKPRNLMVKDFLEDPSLTHLLFIDADMGWNPPGVIIDMLKADEDVVCGVYLSRGSEPFWTCRPLTTELNEKGLLELEAAPTGLMLIKREVIQKIVDERPDLKINFDKRDGEEPNSYLIFDARRSADGTHYMSDDYGFSETWRSLGGKIWCYPDVTISHWWMTKNTGNVKEMLEAKKKKLQLLKETPPSVEEAELALEVQT